MPARPRNLTNPSVYLDQSTWSDAYRSMLPGDPQAGGPYADLLSWLTDAQGVDLCFSVTHVTELALWSKERRAMAEWLERLPLVWVRSGESLKDAEIDYWLRVALGAKPEALSVGAPSMLTALDHLPPSRVHEAGTGSVPPCRSWRRVTSESVAATTCCAFVVAG